MSQVPSGILKEFGLELADDSIFNGSINTENKCSPQLFRLLYSDIWSAEVTSPQLADLVGLNQTIDNNNKVEGAQVISILNYNYHRLKSTILSDNLMTFSNDQFYDVPSRTISPYLGQVLFAASPNGSSFTQEGSGIRVNARK